MGKDEKLNIEGSEMSDETVHNVTPQIETPVSVPSVNLEVLKRVHCESCSKNYELVEGGTPTCCEKPNIQPL